MNDEQRIMKELINESIKTDVDSCESHICNQLMHLLKVTAQTYKLSTSWLNTIYDEMKYISRLITNKNVYNEIDKRSVLVNRKTDIIKNAKNETHLDLYTLESNYDKMVLSINSISLLIDNKFIKSYIDNRIRISNLQDATKKEKLEMNERIFEYYLRKE